MLFVEISAKTTNLGTWTQFCGS